jgi:hypothetical protein
MKKEFKNALICKDSITIVPDKTEKVILTDRGPSKKELNKMKLEKTLGNSIYLT